MERIHIYTYDELQNLSKEDVMAYDKHLRDLRQKAREENDLNGVAFLSRTIEWTSRLLKYKNWTTEKTGETNEKK